MKYDAILTADVSFSGMDIDQYEQAMRRAIVAACEWFDSHPHAAPHFEQMQGAFGWYIAKDQDARNLTDAIAAAVRDHGGLTGIILQFAVETADSIHRHGLDIVLEAYRQSHHV